MLYPARVFDPRPAPELYQDFTSVPLPAAIIRPSGVIEISVTVSGNLWSHKLAPFESNNLTNGPWM